MGTGFSKKKKQAKMLQQQLSQMQTEMQKSEAIGSAGNGLVTLTITGEHEMKHISIKPECVDLEDIEGLEDLIKAAYNDANKKLTEQSQSQMSQMAPGMPNLGGMFGF